MPDPARLVPLGTWRADPVHSSTPHAGESGRGASASGRCQQEPPARPQSPRRTSRPTHTAATRRALPPRARRARRRAAAPRAERSRLAGRRGRVHRAAALRRGSGGGAGSARSRTTTAATRHGEGRTGAALRTPTRTFRLRDRARGPGRRGARGSRTRRRSATRRAARTRLRPHLILADGGAKGSRHAQPKMEPIWRPHSSG